MGAVRFVAKSGESPSISVKIMLIKDPKTLVEYIRRMAKVPYSNGGAVFENLRGDIAEIEDDEIREVARRKLDALIGQTLYSLERMPKDHYRHYSEGLEDLARYLEDSLLNG